ncbi:MAG: divalent-cation tolerance protein CutA [Promethearchaeota archaeon]
MNEYLFFVTVGNFEEARRIGNLLVEKQIAACVNIIKDINSIYMWKGKIENDTEILLIIKTTEEKSEKLIEKIIDIHSYENPECIGVKIDKGSEKYLNWIKDVLN